MRNIASSWFQVLSDAQINDIHKATLDILEHVGVIFTNEEARDILVHHGAVVDGVKVFIPHKLVEESLRLAPASFTLQARNSANSVTIGGAGTVFAPVAGSIYIQDYDGRRREATAKDAVQLLKLVQTSAFLKMNGGMPVVPRDLTEEAMPMFALLASALFTDKPLPGFAHGVKTASRSLEVSSILFGPEARCTMLATVNPTTPLAYDDDETAGMIAFARGGQPICITSCGMAGSTAPVTLAGTLTVSNAEILAGIVLMQLVQPGSPVVYGSLSSVTDMRHISFAAGAPEFSLLLAAAAQLARFYGLPFRGGGALTDAKTMDAQAGYESMMSMLFTAMSGADYLLHAVGVLESLLAVSFEKFVLDEEIGLMAQRVLRGFSVDESSLAVDLIKEIGPQGNFLSAVQTAKQFRQEFFQPRISNRQQYDTWINDGAISVNERAREEWHARIKGYSQPDIEPRIKANLTEFYSSRFGKIPGMELL
jgi:trimethylamine--corrinoid protein Co-methyltransferase